VSCGQRFACKPLRGCHSAPCSVPRSGSDRERTNQCNPRLLLPRPRYRESQIRPSRCAGKLVPLDSYPRHKRPKATAVGLIDWSSPNFDGYVYRHCGGAGRLDSRADHAYASRIGDGLTGGVLAKVVLPRLPLHRLKIKKPRILPGRRPP